MRKTLIACAVLASSFGLSPSTALAQDGGGYGGGDSYQNYEYGYQPQYQRKCYYQRQRYYDDYGYVKYRRVRVCD
jgi:hypothetical protein